MKRLLFIVGMLSLLLGASAQTNITAMEYYIDVDPGHGSGTSIAITSGNQQDISLSVPTIALSPGFHVLAIRALDENGVWSHPEFQPFFISQSTTEARTNISVVEYFLDVDPGYGNGVSVAVTPGTDIDLLEQIPTSSLTPGFHTVYFRVQDASGQWSATEHEPFFISQSTTEARTDISAVEYFLDVDPGYGNGVSVAVTPSTDIDLLEQIPTSSLTPGFHMVYFRVQDASGQWSATEHEPFFISQSTTETRTDISAVEYFLDVDPGYGNGVSVAVTPSTDIELLEQIPTSSLTPGFHTVYFRVQDASGQWSATEHEPFFISQSTTEARTDISAVEYFLDVDPGYGNGVSVAVTPSTDIELLEQIPTSSLTPGFHTVYFRVQDASGQWSATEHQPFFISQSTTEARTDISAVEYFLDADPGYGNGVSVAVTPSTDIELLEQIPTSSLNPGFHTVYFRVQDASGQWSATEHKPFFISQSSTEVRTDISVVEYFLDVDPGHGNGTSVAVTPGTDIDLLEQIPTSSLTPGFHTVYFRVQDASGQWSATEHEPVYIDRAKGLQLIEYAFDVDPGLENGTQIVINPALPVIDQIITMPDASGLAVGPHDLLIRVKDDIDYWSDTDKTNFTVCAGPLADFNIATVNCASTSIDFSDISTNTQAGDVYSWDFDGDGFEDSSFAGDVSFIYPAAGTYEVTLTVDRLGCASSKTKSVIVNDLPVVVANADATTVLLGNSVTLFGSGASSYTWDNGIFDNTPFNPTTTATYTVTGTDSNGCESSDAVTITVVTPEIGVFAGTDNMGTVIQDNQLGVVDIGTAVQTNDITQFFAIENSGTSVLNISSITARSPEFSLNNSIGTIAPGNTETFSVVLSGANTGDFSTTITVVNDDLDEDSFNFQIMGTITSPEIGVFVGSDNSGVELLSGQVAPLDLGSSIEGNDINQSFSIENNGTSDLNVLSISASGADYTVNSLITTVSPGTTETFAIALSGATVGVFNSSVSVLSDDLDEGIFTFPITGEILNGNQPPVLSYVFYVNENSEIGTRIGTIVATDPENDPLTYSILSGNTNEAFSIGNTGDIIVASQDALDFETTPIFDLMVEADDGKGGLSMVSITVRLRDIIDENPLDANVDEGMLIVYPNPAKNVLFISTPALVPANFSIRMYTMTGKSVTDQVTMKHLSSELAMVDLKKLNTGIYILEMKSMKGSSMRNIVVK